MQSRLNELGIFHYWQLADLAPEDVARIEDGLGVKGRIVRDDWAGQARALNEDVAAV
jgi:predicted flap endonuclease-1-like 5' DNA nuclease